VITAERLNSSYLGSLIEVSRRVWPFPAD